MTARIFILLILFPSSLAAAESFTRTQLLMGDIPVTITIRGFSGKKAAAIEAMEKSFTEAKRVEETISEWRPGSQATLLNRNAGKGWVPIGRDLMEILIVAREVSEITEGAFDITFASPDRQATYKDVELIPELSLARLARRRVKIGVSGIAKGYIVDRMSEVLRQNGFRRFLVNAGDLYASGRWEVGIHDPDNPQEKPVCLLTVKDLAVSTSGLYERGPHIIDPRTRRAVSPLKSVTVIAKESALADAFATGAFVLGKDHLQGLAEEVSGILFIDSGGGVGTVGRVSARCREDRTD